MPRIVYPALPTDSAIIDENAMAPVASLKAASDSIRVESTLGTFTFLNISITIAASVGEIKAANANATRNGKRAIYTRRNPPINVARTTPNVASSSADILIALNCL